jgi:hypothetical protein
MTSCCCGGKELRDGGRDFPASLLGGISWCCDASSNSEIALKSLS